MLRGARAAITFLTLVPVGGFPYRREEWRWASGWFPLVGLMSGALMACLWWLAQPVGLLPAASVVYLLSLLLTGGFHEDGLADTADALGGAGDREQLFVVLKDSRVGTYGAMALAVTLLLRVALLAESGSLGWLALLASQSLARVPPVWLMVTMRYLTVAELSKSERISHAGVWQGILALAIGAVVLGYLITAQYLGAGGALALASGLTGGSLVLAWLFHRRAGGITGDFLGATEQVCEVTTLAALVVAWR